ncbi:hypothetical protein ACQEVB_06830 [Pseudonocardia sp. CA-107938]|uniref:hypothetical protein n=1 Tax=Pseudonocardia sp. CA-107938 TaxID=3240021 RepID=UPI003D8F585F
MELPTRPDRTDLDPVLRERSPRRVVVAGDDADLAAVVRRLLRTERLDIEVGYVPAGPTPATQAWGLPHGAAAVGPAVSGPAVPVPLVRDDSGGVLVGRAEIADVIGECWCDEHLVLRGRARRLVVVPTPAGIAVRAGHGRRPPDGQLRALPPKIPAGRGSALGRAVQIGGEPMTVVNDGIAHPRPVPRWTWFRHTTDLLLVRPESR